MKKYLLLLLFPVLLLSCATVKRESTANMTNEIVALMNQSSQDWNAGKLDAFMSLYDTASTFMTSKGPIGLQGMRENYQKGFFDGDKPKQNLRYEDLVVRPLGNDHALLTGKFVLSGNGLSEKRGIYTLVFIRRGNTWKMLHDHSS
ncbi:MAG TPA: nuclear transport factor 2 family protein [Flavisolibacter sp.]|nr:nuclear transport factor 2 family protein [Flavisolibacter sp.]